MMTTSDDAICSSKRNILFFGSALVDFSLDVAHMRQGSLASFGLQPGEECPKLSQDIKDNILQLVESHSDVVTSTCGGAACNCARVTGSRLREIKESTESLDVPRVFFLGSVGKDALGSFVAQQLEAANVHPILQQVESDTGKCVALISHGERTLVAFAGAAHSFTLEYLKSGYVDRCLNECPVMYTTAFSLTTPANRETVHIMAARAQELCFNIASANLIPRVFEAIMQVLPQCKIVFGNIQELLQLYHVGNRAHDDSTACSREKAIEDALQWLKSQVLSDGIVVMTNGAHPCAVVADHQHIQYFETPKIDPHHIVDTNGAGDSFVGGFLAEWVCGQPIPKCIETALNRAAQTIQVRGCHVPT